MHIICIDIQEHMKAEGRFSVKQVCKSITDRFFYGFLKFLLIGESLTFNDFF